MKNKLENSKALKRVWKWKDEIYNDVKELNLDQKLKKIHEMANSVNKINKLINTK